MGGLRAATGPTTRSGDRDARHERFTMRDDSPSGNRLRIRKRPYDGVSIAFSLGVASVILYPTRAATCRWWSIPASQPVSARRRKSGEPSASARFLTSAQKLEMLYEETRHRATPVDKVTKGTEGNTSSNIITATAATPK